MDSQTNLEVAQLTRRDGNLMKSIATLGMIFLPATFVTAFFSMGFFDWGDETMSRYIWVYVVAALVTTLVTVALFYCLILRRWKQPRSPVGTV
ncbi:hypothetical protein F5X68DRAFT_262123 [Plectosphaerella plurivora]|uniref:Uncharacterized protein n=1 Tax=Plectosphaerella plurivora TaxID=936078 RepID=A0A9P8VA79_9PEZI|nr:hypothetical protein F5X68DRAFT_262123 [Plectosphaerella plurivora]